MKPAFFENQTLSPNRTRSLILPDNSKILLYIGYPPETGYAINRLKMAFASAAGQLAESGDHVVTAWAAPDARLARVSPSEVIVDSRLRLPETRREFVSLLQDENIWGLLGLDLELTSPHVRLARTAGVESIISYWGAPMTGRFPMWLRPLKAMQTKLNRKRPDHYIFESEAMRRTGVINLGIPPCETSMVPLGVNLKRFTIPKDSGYCARIFGFNPSRHVVVYSGHFEERKGLAVLIRAAIDIIDRRRRRDIHFVLAGNRTADQASPYRNLLRGSTAEGFVTFAGYRSDLPSIFADAYLGCIPSSGWDSLTVSAIEMQASGVPVIVSALQGLPEAIIPGETGLTFRPCDHQALANLIIRLVDDTDCRKRMSKAAVRHASLHFSEVVHEARLAEVMRQQFLRKRRRWENVNAWGAVDGRERGS